jgi:spore coat polysaccharide biosynthesis protein SpsF (cytidylyltransferase family)
MVKNRAKWDKNIYVIVIIQARVGSKRLPGKVMLELFGKTILIHDLERIKKMETIDKIAIATTTFKQDDIIVNTVKEYDENIGIYRGSSEDVLDRYYKAAKDFKADAIVRITSDASLIDPKISDRVVETFLKSPCDYCCNNMPRTYPYGLDTEVFSFESLERAWKGAHTPYEREHVTPYIRENPDKFILLNVENNEDLSNLRWALDYLEDFEFITEIYKRLYPKKRIFYMKDILDVLNKEPWLVEINSKYTGD